MDAIWPGLTAICRIERTRETATFCTREIVHAITSVSVERATPEYLLSLSRDHWNIENGLFHVRDVTFREDHCRVRTGAAPRVLSSIRDFVLAAIRRRGDAPRPGREFFAENKAEAIALVTGRAIMN